MFVLDFISSDHCNDLSVVEIQLQDRRDHPDFYIISIMVTNGMALQPGHYRPWHQPEFQQNIQISLITGMIGSWLQILIEF